MCQGNQGACILHQWVQQRRGPFGWKGEVGQEKVKVHGGVRDKDEQSFIEEWWWVRAVKAATAALN